MRSLLASIRSTAARARGRDERGETLVELLITVVIIGIAFTALLAGLATAMTSGRTHRQQANADVVLPAAADSVKSQTYVPCNTVTTSSYNPTTNVTVPSGWSPLSSYVTITSVKGWNGSAFVTCSSSSTDKDLELVTVQVVTPGTPNTTESVDVVKRDLT